MRMILSLSAVASFALLAACGGGGANNATGNAAPAANETGPAASGPATPAPPPAANGDIQECVSDVANELPAGTDVNAFCNCAVGKMATNGGRERPAMEACASEMGIQPRQR
jgi:hypothetical protein